VVTATDVFENDAGPVELLANVAGWDRPVSFLDTDRAFWDKVIGINLYGPLNLHHVVVKRMAERGFGRVVTVSSDAGRVGSSGEAVYSAATRDSDERLLNGSNNYVMHFPADKLPDSVVGAYWSVILVGVPDYRVVPNPLKRYNFNNHSPLQKEADGSLKITIGPMPVAGVPETNWLPSPEGKPFSLTFRTYVPKDIVKRGEWQPAAVTAVK